MKRVIIVIAAVLLAIVFFGFVLLPAITGGGYSLTVQHYDSEGNAVGNPISSSTPYLWMDEFGNYVSVVQVTVSWEIVIQGVDPSSIFLSGTINIGVGGAAGAIDSKTWDSTDLQGTHTESWELADFLTDGLTDIQIQATLEVTGIDELGQTVYASWSDAVTISYTYEEGSITVNGAIGA